MSDFEIDWQGRNESQGERQKERENNTVMRPKVSNGSLRKLGEYIHHAEGSEKEALAVLANIVTESDWKLTEWTPWRDVSGRVVVRGIELQEDERLVATLSVDDEEQRLFFRDTESTYRLRELHDGEYTLSVKSLEKRTYDKESLEYETTKLEYTADDERIMIDTHTTTIKELDGPKIAVEVEQ